RASHHGSPSARRAPPAASIDTLLPPERADRVVSEARRETEEIDADHRERPACVADAAVGVRRGREQERDLARDRAEEFHRAVLDRELVLVERAVEIRDRLAVEEAHDIEAVRAEPRLAAGLVLRGVRRERRGGDVVAERAPLRAPLPPPRGPPP